MRSFAALLISWLVLGRVVIALLWDPAWAGSSGSWWPALSPNPRVYTAAARIYHLGSAVLAVVFLAMVAVRLGRSSGLMRLRTWPTAALAPFGAIAFGLQSVSWLVHLPDDTFPNLSILADAVLLSIPAAFAVIALQQRLERTRVADIILRIGHDATPEQIRAALRTAVAEPRLELAFRLPDSTGWIDVAGHPVRTSGFGNHLIVPLDDSDGRPLALVITDARLAAHGDVLDPALVAVRLSLENSRLQAVALARLREVKQSRQGLLAAGIEERHRVERDLHDGAQQRLLAVAASISRARARAADPGSLAVLDAARDDLRAALAELRGIATGLRPPALAQCGLGAALEGVTERLPLRIRTDVEARRWPDDIEMAAYFVICECLANVVKHSGAASATVSARQGDGGLLLTIEDNGSGGAVSAPGRGLAGLGERIAALGGTLSVDSALGNGTRVDAALPCP